MTPDDLALKILAEHGPFEHEGVTWCRMCVSPTGWPAGQLGIRFPCPTRRVAEDLAHHGWAVFA